MASNRVLLSLVPRAALFGAASAVVLGLGWASPAAAAVCTVSNPPAGPNGFATIQAAVAANNCSVINVKPGTYQGPITINRNLTLRGASAQTTTIDLAGNVVNPLTAIIEIAAPATKVTVERFTIKGPGAGGCGSLLYGILVRDGAKATIQNNHLTAIRDQPLSGCQNGNAIQIGRNTLNTHGHGVIKNNTIDDYQKTGIIVDGRIGGPQSTAVITGNEITGDTNGACSPNYRCAPIAAQNGIQISRNATAEVTGNTVVGNRYDPAVADSVGIMLFGAGDDVTVTRNTADANDVGIWIGTSNATVSSNKVKNSSAEGIAIAPIAGSATGFNTVRRNTATANGIGIGLYDTDSNLVDQNNVSRSEGSGIFVDDTSNGNFVTKNRSMKNDTFGIEDESTGSGTAGTANSYTGNTCTGNGSGKSDPADLC
jgi:parallel beta-helix repeat protein